MELNEDLKLNELQIVCHCCLMVCSGLESILIQEPKRRNEDKFTTISQLYAECIGSEIDLDNDIPLRICQQCYEKLNEAVQFRKQCLRALNILSSLKKNKKPAETIKPNNELIVPNDTLTIKEEPVLAQDVPNGENRHSSISIQKKPRNKKQRDELIVSNHKIKTVKVEQDPVKVPRKYKKRSSLLELPKDKKKKIIRPVMCQICGKMQSNMTVHMHVHAEKRLFECDLCGKTFTQKMNLHTHLIRHVTANVRRFTCEVCGYAFLQKSTMQSHMLIHSNTKKFACDMCPSTFIQKYRLNDHRLSHIQNRKFACPHCDKAFVRNSGLRNHIGIHTGQRAYGCFFCGKNFLNTSSATMHRKTHQVDSVFVCPVCDTFRTGDLRIFKLHWYQNHQRTPGETKSIGEMMYSSTDLQQQSNEYNNVWQEFQ